MSALLKIFLTVAALTLCLCNLDAQTRSVGASFSLSGIGISYEHTKSDESFIEASIKTELWEVLNDRSVMPGISAGFTWNLILKSWKSKEGNSVNVFAGAGITGGYANDYKKPDGCFMGLKGRFGVEYHYQRNIQLSFCIIPVIGTHIHKEGSNLKMEYYKAGLINTLMPEIGIKYMF